MRRRPQETVRPALHSCTVQAAFGGYRNARRNGHGPLAQAGTTAGGQPASRHGSEDPGSTDGVNEDGWTQLASLDRVAVYQATGMLMGALNVDQTEALVRLRAHGLLNRHDGCAGRRCDRGAAGPPHHPRLAGPPAATRARPVNAAPDPWTIELTGADWAEREPPCRGLVT